MATIYKVSAGYRVRWRDPDKKSQSKTFKRSVDAKAHAALVEHSKNADTYVDPAAGRQTVEDYAREWAASQVWRPSTRVRQDAIITNHLAPRFGNRQLSSVRPSEVQGFVKVLADTLAPGTVKGIVGTLTAVYAAAVRDRLVTHNPCDAVKLPKQARRRVEPLTAEQVELLLDGIGEPYRPLVMLGAGAGLRVGEALGVELRHVDFLRREVRVVQQSTTVKRVTSLGPVKTPASRRTVPLGDTVVAELARWLERNPRDLGELLVADEDGDPVPQNRFSQTWARTVVRVGLPKGTRFHDLRHTYASALISAGCSVVAVQNALGHDSASTTLDIYSHLWPSDQDRTRGAIDAFLGADVSPARHDDDDVAQTRRSAASTGQMS